MFTSRRPGITFNMGIGMRPSAGRISGKHNFCNQISWSCPIYVSTKSTSISSYGPNRVERQLTFLQREGGPPSRSHTQKLFISHSEQVEAPIPLSRHLQTLVHRCALASSQNRVPRQVSIHDRYSSFWKILPETHPDLLNVLATWALSPNHEGIGRFEDAFEKNPIIRCGCDRSDPCITALHVANDHTLPGIAPKSMRHGSGIDMRSYMFCVQEYVDLGFALLAHLVNAWQRDLPKLVACGMPRFAKGKGPRNLVMYLDAPFAHDEGV
ncbi:hypothetical protein BDV98DRAFT_583159 [Pterulicium gracile]|uniref:Uncharacterized protein n=1 Tax=Pterulicium gracile TaxID=1884261 RepID=A0A5C3QGC7_9AGAR|nr:hypothetical protein BDV98DRAFT_583159 [Pterula gracilis]